MRWIIPHQSGFSVEERADVMDSPLGVGDGFESLLDARAVHEFLFQPTPGEFVPLFPALMAAKTTVASTTAGEPLRPKMLVWVDSSGDVYPPAIVHAGVTPEQLLVLRPRAQDRVWAAIEALRCRTVGAVVAVMNQPLSRVDVRRLQLAAETGGGMGVLIRPHSTHSTNSTQRNRQAIYAAATRWLVSPAVGERTVQRWRLEQIHGHGGHTHPCFILENHRDSGQSHFVRVPAPMVHHPLVQAAS